MFTCGISGRVPSYPVVTRTAGVLYEKSLIEAYIDLHHRCPVTGDALERTDLQLLYGCSPRSFHDASLFSFRPHDALNQSNNDDAEDAQEAVVRGQHGIPSLLQRLQVEWQSMQIEQFSLRHQLAQTRQELAHALHKNEAACRVIARLRQTAEALRESHDTGGDGDSGRASPSCVEAAVVVLPLPVVEVLDAQVKRCREARQMLPSTLGHPPLPPAERFAFLSVDGEVVGSTQSGKRGGDDNANDNAALVGSVYTCAAMLYARGTEVGKEGMIASPPWVGLGSTEGHLDLLHRETGMVYPLAGLGHSDLVHTLITASCARREWSEEDEGGEEMPPSKRHRSSSSGSGSHRALQGAASTTTGVVKSLPTYLISASLDKTVKIWRVIVAEVEDAVECERASSHPEEGEEMHALKKGKAESTAMASDDKREGGPGEAKGRRSPYLSCVDTLHYAHGVSAIAPTLAAGRYLVAAGDSRHGAGPYVYVSDLFPDEEEPDTRSTARTPTAEEEKAGPPRRVGAYHVAVVNVGASGPASSAPFSVWHGGSDSGSSWGVLHALAVHPYGTMAGLLLHASSSYWPSLTWNPPTSAAGVVGRPPSLPSVLVIWDLKKMVVDTVVPVVPSVWETTPSFQTHQQEQGPSLSVSAAGIPTVCTSIDFAADTVHLAVGLSDGGVLVYVLRSTLDLLAYIPPPPPSMVWSAAGSSNSNSTTASEEIGMRGGPLPATIKFCTNYVGNKAEEEEHRSGKHKKNSSSSSPATTCLAVAVGAVLTIYDVRDLRPDASTQPWVKQLSLSSSSTESFPFMSRCMACWSSPGDRESVFAVSGYNSKGVVVCSTEEE